MTIFIDSRKGSAELIDLFSDALLVKLEFGDCAFEGNGPQGRIQIGIERKRCGDLIQSISSGRLSGHQLPGLLETYYKVYLIVEGIWRANRKDGTVEVFRHGKFKPLGSSRFTSKRIWGYLTALNASTGVEVFITPTIEETALVIEELEHWWNQPWEKHVSHLMVNKLSPPSAYLRPGRPSLIRRIALELPGIGYDRVVEVEKKFKTV
jgi:ERCC4-type nuclease